MANKLLDAIRGIFGKKPEHNLDSTGKPTTSAAPASTPTTTSTTQPQQPQQQAPVYKDNSVVYKNEQGNGGIYQYKSPDKLKSQNELNEQWKYAMQLGYNRDQAIDALRNGTRWKSIALGQNGRPIISYQGDKYTSQEEVNEQYAIASGMGMKRDDIVKAMRQGVRWREQTDDDLKEEYTAGSYGNAANNKQGALGNLGWMYENGSERASTVAGNKKYWDILNADDFAEKSKPGEAKTRAFGGDRRYDYINDIGNTRAVEDTAAAGRMGTSEFAKYGFMTDDEVGIYNYLYATKGKQAANQFLDEIDSQLNEQRATGIENSMSQVANESGWNQAAMTGVTALAAPMRGISGMAAMAQDAYDTWRGNEIDPNSRFHRMSNNTNAVRQAIGDSLGKKAGDFVAKKWSSWSGGKEAAEAVVPWTYDVVTSALDSMMNALTGSYLAGTGFQPGMSLRSLWDATNKITTVIMSSEAAANGVALSKEKGYSNFGALSLGFYRGMMEYLSEKYGGDWVNKKIAGDQANFWVYAARAFIPEFLEEIASDVGNEILNVTLDILAGTDESYIVNAYKELEAAGSENIWGDLAKVIITEELKSGLSGGLSALGTGAGRFNNYRTTLNKSALTLNTDTKTLSEMMRRNDIDDPGHVARMVELYDVNSVEEFETELKKYKDIADAIDAKMAEYGQKEAEQQAQQQTASQQAAQFAEDDKLGEYEAIALDDITSLSDDELIEYTQLLRDIRDQYSMGDEAQQELADGRYTKELEAAMAEGRRRQDIREASAQNANEPVAEQASETPVEEEPSVRVMDEYELVDRINSLAIDINSGKLEGAQLDVAKQQLQMLRAELKRRQDQKGYNTSEVESKPVQAYNGSAVKPEPQKAQPTQKKAENKPADNSYDGYSDEELEKRKANIDKRIVAMQRKLDSNELIDEERRHVGTELAKLRLESGAISDELYERRKKKRKENSKKSSNAEQLRSSKSDRKSKPAEAKDTSGKYPVLASEDRLTETGQTKRPLKDIFEEMRAHLANNGTIDLIVEKIKLGRRIGKKDKRYRRSFERKEDIDRHAILTKEVGARMIRYSGFEDFSEQYWDYEKKRYARNEELQKVIQMERQLEELDENSDEFKELVPPYMEALARYNEAQAILNQAELKLVNALEMHERKGAQDNGSDQGDAEDNSGISAREAALGNGNPVQEQRVSEPVAQERGDEQQDQAAERAGNREGEEEQSADTASGRTGESRNTGNQTVQRTVSDERTRRVDQIFDAVAKHFNIVRFIKNPTAFFNNAHNLAVFGRNTLRRVFGSAKNASQFVNAWMNDETNQLIMQPANSIVGNAKLDINQKRDAYQAFVCEQIMKDLMRGSLSAQDIADIGGFSIEEAQAIADRAEQRITESMIAQKILSKDGTLKSNLFRLRAKAGNRRSGARNTVAELTEDIEGNTAQSFNLTDKYKPKPGDTEYEDNNPYGNKIYRRGNTFIVVNKGGYILAEAEDGTDVQNAERNAHMAAQRNSPSYDVASVNLFGGSHIINNHQIYFDSGNGMVIDARSVFRKSNMKSVYGSRASAAMNIKYTDTENGSRMGTSAWFKLNLSVDSDYTIGSLTNATDKIREIITRSYSYTKDEDGTWHRGVKMSNGKYYVFFGMTSSGAKKGDAIMVDEQYYNELRKLSLGGKSEEEVAKFNPAKYLTASTSIFSPSNADTGIKIARDYKKNGKAAIEVAVVGDVFTTRFATLRQFMMVDKAKNSAGGINLDSVDYQGLVKVFSDSMIRQLMDEGVSKADAEKQAAEVIPDQVKDIIARNDVGSVLNIMADLMFNATDGTGFVTLPKGSPYEGQSIQMRSLGGFKAQLIGFQFSDYLHAVIPFNPDAEYVYTGEDRELAGGFRYRDKDVGVEVLSYFGLAKEGGPTEEDWIPVKQLKAILFNSTVKFAGEYTSTQDFYETCDNEDIRSIPRENVYGSSTSDSALEGFETRGVGQALRSQMNFTEEEVKAVLDKRIDLIINHIKSDPKIAGKFLGVDFDGPPPKKSDYKAHTLYYRGVEYLNSYEGAQWLSDKMGRLIEGMRQGQIPFKEGEAQHGWIDPDVVGLVKAMTAITKIADQTAPTLGGGFSLNGSSGLTPGQIFAANLNNKDEEGNKNNTTAIARFPSMKAIDVQVRENLGRDDPTYKEMIERFGLDKGNIYVAINDVLSMYLDNDYDGDPVITFQTALADLYKMIRSRDYLDKDGKPMKKNVLVATAKGIQNTPMESTDFGPVEFSHAKADKVEIAVDGIHSAVMNYLRTNDMTDSTWHGPRTVGMYANMVDRLASIPDWALEKTIEAHPEKYGNMTAKELRAWMEAQFGVASVLSIDFAKTGRQFEEFFTLVDRLNSELYDIADDNGLIEPLPRNDKEGKIKRPEYFIPAWWGFGSNAKKVKDYNDNPGSRVKGSENLRTIINKLLPEKAKNDKGFTSWYNTLASKLYRGRSLVSDWSGAMTADYEQYSFLSDDFFKALDDYYKEVTTRDNKEFKFYQRAVNIPAEEESNLSPAQKLRLNQARAAIERFVGKNYKEIKDIDIRGYLIYKNIQKKLGLNNQQFTDLMLAMLTRNSDKKGTTKSVGAIAGFDQNQYSKSTDELSSTEIYQRNINRIGTLQYFTRELKNTNDRINAIASALIKAREKISKFFDSKKTTLGGADAAVVARIADIQSYLERTNQQFKDSFNALVSARMNTRTRARDITVEDIDEFRNRYQAMREQIAEMKSQLIRSGSLFTTSIADEVNSIYGEVDKELRDTLRHIDAMARTLNDLYDEFIRDANKAEAATAAAAGVFTDATTGLEGLTEEQILDKIRRVTDATDGVQSDNSGREDTSSKASGNRQNQQQGTSRTNQGTSEQETGKTPGINTEAERALEENKAKETKERTLATAKSGEELVYSVSKDGKTKFIVKDQTGDTYATYELPFGVEIIPTKKMNLLQRATKAVLKKIGVHIVYTTGPLVKIQNNERTPVYGVDFSIEDTTTGEKFIVAAVTMREGRVTVRHESIHALIEKLGSPMDQYFWMLNAVNELVSEGYISQEFVDQATKRIEYVYFGTGPVVTWHEFFAQLFSGGDFYGNTPDISLYATRFMVKGLDEYQKTGTFPVLSDLINQALPDATDQEKKEILRFVVDSFTSEDYSYAQKVGANPEIDAEQTTSNPTTEESTAETEPVAEEQPNEQPNEPQPEPPSFGGKRRNIARSIVKIQRALDTTVARLNALSGVNTESHVAILSDFSNSLKQFLNGDITAKDLYLAYNNLKGTMFYDEEVEPFFNELADPRKYYIRDAAGGITGLTDAYNEAIDHAFAKMGAFAGQVVKAEQTNSQLTNEAVKREEKNVGQKALNYLGSWQVNAPTWFKSLVGYKKGSVGYALAKLIEHCNKMMQRHYWGAYQHLQNVAKMDGYQELIKGEYTIDLPSALTDNKEVTISTIEAINLYRMMKSVKYTQGSLANVVGFRLGEETQVRTAYGHGKARNEMAQKLYEELDDYFTHNARAVEKAYLKMLDNVFGYFTPEVQRVGKALNGYVDMIPAEEYSPVYWGTNKVEENFDPKEAQLKSDPRYMKERIEEAGGYLYINPMDEVIETYIRRMSDYLAFGEAREQLRLMNKTADFRDTKTLGQIAGENMGESYARFINNYVRDFIHYSDNSNSFWYKARMAMQKGTLVGNASVMMKQSASYLNAASVIDMKYLIQALTPTEFGKDYANGKSGLLEYRRITGNFDPSITDIFGKKASRNPFVRAFQNGISIIDYKTVKRLYVAACLQVQAETNYKVGSAEFDEAVENLFSDAAISTQPQFDPSLRAENARTTNEGVRMLSMFRTQQTQNFNKILTAFGEMKANPDAQSKAQWRATIGGLIGSGLALALFTSIADAALHRKKKYRDKGKDDEITAEKILKRIGMNSAEAIAGTMWFGDDLSKLLIDMISAATGGDTKEFYGVSMGPISTIYDAATSLKDFVDAIADGKGVLAAGKKLAGYVTQLGGFPLNNLYNYINTVAMYSKDILGTNPDDYDDFLKWLDSENTAQKRLIRAAEKGNDRKTNNLWETLQKRYANPSSELNEQLHKDYDRGKVSEDTAQNLLVLYGRLEDEDAAKKRVAWWDFKKEHPEYEDMTEANVAKWNSVAKPAGVPLDTFYKATKHFAELRKDKENGKDNLSMLQYIDSLGLNQSQKDALWNCFGTNVYTPYDSTKGVYADYQNYGKPAGFTAETFTAYYDKCNSFNSDKDKNGKTTKSKQQKVIAYINSLNISKAQKDALFLSMDYKKTSKAWKTRPWR